MVRKPLEDNYVVRVSECRDREFASLCAELILVACKLEEDVYYIQGCIGLNQQMHYGITNLIGGILLPIDALMDIVV